jgi:hypothetical protein
MVIISADIPGRLFLDAMPVRYESFARAKSAIIHAGVDRVVCLAPLDEVQRKSPDYVRAIQQGELPWVHVAFDVPDHHAPEDRQAFLRLA